MGSKTKSRLAVVVMALVMALTMGNTACDPGQAQPERDRSLGVRDWLHQCAEDTLGPEGPQPSQFSSFVYWVEWCAHEYDHTGRR